MFLTKARTLVLCLGLALVVLAAYANHFQNRFHLDDAQTIVQNSSIRQLHTIPGFFTDATRFSVNQAGQLYRPIVSTSLAIDYAVGRGYKPVFFHLSTFLWFVVLVCLIFLLFRRIMDRVDPHPSNLWVAMLAAACYGLHPANAETLNYITQRSDVYATLDIVASLLLFIAYPERRKQGWYLLLAITACLSSAIALVFPLLLLAYVVLMEQDEEGRPNWSAALRETLPAWLVTAVMAIFLWKMTPLTYDGGAPSPWLYRATEPWVAFRYFKSFFLPTGLSADSDWTPVPSLFHWEVLVGCLFVAGLLWVVARTAKRPAARPVAFGLLWFLIALLPTSLAATRNVTSDHRMFFPFVGLTLAVFWELRLIVFRKTERLTVDPVWMRGALAAAGIVLILAATGTHFRNQVWNTDDTLWEDVTIKSPKNPRGLMNYGMAAMSRREYGTALIYLERAQQLDPTNGPVEANLGAALGALDRPEAEQHFRRAVELARNVAEPRIFYARWLESHHRLREAQILLESALTINRTSMPARELLGQVYAEQGNKAAFNQLMEETVKLTLSEEQAKRYYAERDAREKAIQAAKFPSSLKPEDLVNVAARLCQNHNFEDCLLAAQTAVERRPGYAEAYNNMSAAYLSMGRWDEGIEAARQAIRSKPNYDAAKSNLAWGLSQKAKAAK